MKKLLVILLMILIVGCAAPEATKPTEIVAPAEEIVPPAVPDTNAPVVTEPVAPVDPVVTEPVAPVDTEPVVTEPVSPMLPDVVLPRNQTVKLGTGETNRGAFTPETLTIMLGDEVTWLNEENKPRVVACYLDGKRIFLGKRMEEGDTVKHTFDVKGRYVCKEAIYGANSQVIVN